MAFSAGIQKAEAVTRFKPARANRTLPRMGVYRAMNQPVDVQNAGGHFIARHRASVPAFAIPNAEAGP